MIVRVQRLMDFPANPVIPILQFSPGGPFVMKKGLIVQMEDHQGDKWIGNFQPGGEMDPLLLASGVAFVMAGPSLYVFNSEKATKTFEAFKEKGDWIYAKIFKKEGFEFFGVGSDDGHIQVFSDKGKKLFSVHVAEDAQSARHELDGDTLTWTCRWTSGQGEKTSFERRLSLPDLT